MKKFLPKIFLATSALSLTLFTLLFLLIYSENYLFDNLYYRKSIFHGYHKNHSKLPGESTPKLIENRVNDVRMLVSSIDNDSSQVLGVSDNDNYNIAVIGDSFVYGTGLRDNQRFVNILERKLNKIKPTKVYSYAIPSDSILENYTKFKISKEQNNIDLYVIGLVDNDLLIDPFTFKYAGQENDFNYLKKDCPQPVFNPNNDDPYIKWEDMLITLVYPSFSSEYSGLCFLNKISSEIAQENSIFFVLSSFDPSDDNNNTSSPYGHYLLSMHKYVNTIRDNGGNVLNDSKIQFEPISEAEGHPSVETNKQYAESLFNEITTNKRYNF